MEYPPPNGSLRDEFLRGRHRAGIWVGQGVSGEVFHRICSSGGDERLMAICSEVRQHGARGWILNGRDGLEHLLALGEVFRWEGVKGAAHGEKRGGVADFSEAAEGLAGEFAA